MRKIKVLIVDDESDARALIKSHLESFEETEIIGESTDGRSAIRDINDLQPDLVFLDIEMPEYSGFDVIKKLSDLVPYIVFVTAYDEYAIQAFEVNAVDYVLKPYAASRLRSAFGRARDVIINQDFQEISSKYDSLLAALDEKRKATVPPKPYLQKFAIKTSSRTAFIDPLDVHWIEAADQYVRLHTASGKHLLRDSMDRLEKVLDAKVFFRCHRSSMVNLREVVAMDQLDGKHMVLVLKDGSHIKMTNSRKDQFKELMGW